MVRGADSTSPVMLSTDQARRIGVTFAAVTLEELSAQIRAAGLVPVGIRLPAGLKRVAHLVRVATLAGSQ